MPLFFILSGYTFKQRNNLVDELLVSFRRLIIPYLLYSCVFFCIDILLFGINSSVIQKDISNIQLGRGSFGVLWFLLSLFLVRIVYSVIDKYFKNASKSIIVSVVVLTGYVLNYLFKIYAFTIITSLVSLGFFYFGHILKISRFNYTKIAPKAKMAYSIILILVSIITCYLNHVIYHTKIELSGAVFNSLPITYLGALSGSLIVIFISNYIECTQLPFKRILKHLGLFSLWYYPITAYIPNRFSQMVNGTHFDNFVIKTICRIFAFGLTYLIILIANRERSSKKKTTNKLK